jgi:hypothetical protein
MFQDEMVHRVNIRIVYTLKGAQSVDMVQMFVGKQNPQELVFVLLNKIQNRLINITWIDNYRFPGGSRAGIVGAQDITVTESKAAVMKI